MKLHNRHYLVIGVFYYFVILEEVVEYKQAEFSRRPRIPWCTAGPRIIRPSADGRFTLGFLQGVVLGGIARSFMIASCYVYTWLTKL